MSAAEPIWKLSVVEAKRRRWARGVVEFRDGDPSRPFEGTPLEELYVELIDALNYLDEEVRVTMPAFTKSTVLQMLLRDAVDIVRAELERREV